MYQEEDRCRVEIASIEALLRAGHPDVEGLVLALADWSQELRMIEREKRKPPAVEAGGNALRRVYSQPC